MSGSLFKILFTWFGQGSLYLAFPEGKRELFEKALLQYHRESFHQFEKALKENNDPIALIRDFFRIIARTEVPVHLRGCFIGNTVVEMAGQDPELAKTATNILKEVENLFFRTIKRAQATGQLNKEHSPEILARHLITLWNGLNITRRMYHNNTKLQPLIEMQLQVLN